MKEDTKILLIADAVLEKWTSGSYEGVVENSDVIYCNDEELPADDVWSMLQSNDKLIERLSDGLIETIREQVRKEFAPRVIVNIGPGDSEDEVELFFEDQEEKHPKK